MAPTQEALYDEIDLELSWSSASCPSTSARARPPPPPVPRQVHPAARRGPARALRPARRPRARPVRGVRHHARAGARERPRRDRGHRRVQRAPDARQDHAVQPRCSSVTSARRPPDSASSTWGGSPARAPTCVGGMRRALADLLAFRSSATTSIETCSASCSRGPRARRDGRRTSTSTFLAIHSVPVLVPQAQAGVQTREPRRTSSAGTRSTRSRASSVLARGGAEGRSAAILHGDARALDLGGPYDGIVTSPPYPG